MILTSIYVIKFKLLNFSNRVIGIFYFEILLSQNFIANTTNWFLNLRPDLFFNRAIGARTYGDLVYKLKKVVSRSDFFLVRSEKLSYVRTVLDLI